MLSINYATVIDAVETFICSLGNSTTEIPMEGENWWEVTESESGGLTDEESEKMAAILEEKRFSIEEAGPYLAVVEVNALLRDFTRRRKVASTRQINRHRVWDKAMSAGFLLSFLYVIGVLFFGLSSVIESVVPVYGDFGSIAQACCFWPVFLVPALFLDSQADPNHALIDELRTEYSYAAKYYTNWSLFGQSNSGLLPTNITTSEEHASMSLEWVTCSQRACDQRVPSWTGVRKGNECTFCDGQFCPHHLNIADDLSLESTSCNNC